MRTFKSKAAGVLLGVWFAFSGWAQNCQNCCPETGPHNNPYECLQQGQVTSSGALNFTSTNLCAGSSVIAPTLTQGVSVSSGRQINSITYDCTPSMNHYVTNTITYSIGGLFFTPTNFNWPSSITGPFNAPGTYVYLAQVNASSIGSICPTIKVTVATVTITVTSSPPVIITQPQGQTVPVGANAPFSVVGTGCPSVTYQWYFNATNSIPNAINPSLTVTNVQTTNAGNYTVVLTDSSGSVTSAVAVLQILVTQQCTNSPSGLIGWWKGENNANDTAGTNNGVLQNAGYTTGVVGNAFAFDPENFPNGTHTGVKIQDNPAYALTDGFSIEVWVRPRGNGYAIFWRGDNRAGDDPYSLSMQNNNHVRITISDTNGNSPYVDVPLVYNQWWHLVATFDGGAGVLKLYTNGVLAGQTNTIVVPIGSLIPSDSPGVGIGNVNDGQSNFPFLGDIDEASLYSRAISASEVAALYNAGAGGKCPLTPPTIIVQPAINQTVNQGENATFSVVAASITPISYQWQFNQANISGATDSSYTSFGVQTSDAGNYRVIVSNVQGSVTSSNSHLTVLVPPAITTQPVSAAVTYGNSASFTVTATGATQYQWQRNGVNIPGATTSTYTLTKPGVSDSGGIYTVVVYGASGGHLTSAPAFLTVNRAQLTVTADNFSRQYGAANPTFTWHYSGFITGDGPSVISGAPIVSTTAASNSPVAGSPYTIAISAGDDDDPSMSATNYSFNFVNGQLSITKANLSVTANNQAKATGSPNPTLTGVINPSFVPGDNISVTYITTATTGSTAGTYPIIPILSDPNDKLQNYNVTIGNGTLTVSDAPLITAQPVSIARAPLSTAVAAFTVQAVGSPSLIYRWSKNNQLLTDGGNISGSGTPTLTITGISSSDAGNYSVSVQNSVGTNTSMAATLMVTDAAVTNAPTSHFASPGGLVTFNVGVQSVCNPPGYKWNKDGTALTDGTYWPSPTIASNIAGSATATVSLANIRATASGTYTAKVSCNQTTNTSPGGVLQVCNLYPIAMNTNTVLSHKDGDSITVNFDNNAITNFLFGWLSWNLSTSDTTLESSFQSPDSFNYINPVDLLNEPPIDSGKLVRLESGTKANVIAFLSSFIGQEMAVVVWDQYNSQYNAVRVYSFARITITAVNANGNNNSWITYTLDGIGRCNDQCFPPTVSLPSGNITYTEKQPPMIIDSAAAVQDLGDPNLNGWTLNVNFTSNGSSEDVISVQNQGTGSGQIGVATSSGVTSITYGGATIGTVVGPYGSSSLQVAFNTSATREAATALLDNLMYQDTSCNPSTLDRVLQVVMNNANSCSSVPVTKTIHVVSVNDQPTLGNLSNITVPSCSAPITVQLSGITAGCSENQTLTVTATSSVPGLIPNPTVTYVSPNTTGTLGIAPTGTGIGTATITVTVQDNGGTANGGVNSITKTFNVTVLDCAPVIAFQSTLAYTENSPATVIDPNFQISDPDSANFGGGSLTVDFAANGQAEDRLGIQAAGGITVSGQAVSYQGTQIGTFSGGTGTQPLVISLNANATVTATLALARHLTYNDVADPPSTLTRTVRAVLNDGVGGISAPTTTSITVSSVNGAPVANPDSYSVAQGATLTVGAPGVLGNDHDVDGDSLTASVVTLPTHGSLTLNPDGSFVYQPFANNTSSSDSFVYKATDNGTTGGQPDPKSATATVSISIAAPTCVAQGLSISLDNNTIQSGTPVGGTISLAAPTTLVGGQVINLTSDTASVIPPLSILIPQGSQTAQFTIQTASVSVDTTATITASYPGKPSASANLTITAAPPETGVPTDEPSGFKYSVLMDQLPNGGDIGPIGMVKNSFGQVLVSLLDNSELILIPDTDGQHYDSSVNTPVLTGVSIYGMARLNNKIYGVVYTGGFGGLAEFSDNGTIIRELNLPGLGGLLGLSANPQNGLLYSTDGGTIYEIDPISQTYRVAVQDSASFDGVAVSPDGTTVYAADNGDNSVRGYDIVSGAMVFNVQVSPPNGGTIDGIAVGQGTLSGKLFVNCTAGELMEIDIASGVPTTFSSEQGSRGDFVLVDDDGSLLITQTARILRLTPPTGSSFGGVKGTICVRNDQSTTYSPITLNTSTPVVEGVSALAASFDVRGISGSLISASISRSGSLNYSANNVFQMEYGIAPFDPLNINPNKDKSYAPQAALAAASPGNVSYSPTWSLPPAYLQNLQGSLGANFQVLLADRISSVCGTVTLTDTPQAQWPQGRNTLVFLATSTADPQIPVGSSLDMALFGQDTPLNGDWDIVLNGSIVASSGNPNGWGVELDQTPYSGAIVSVPVTATIANGYEVRVAALSESGRFDVVPASAVLRAPTLLPIGFSANPVSAGSSVNITISLDQPASASGVSVFLTSDNASVSVPSSVQIAGGTKSTTITVAIPSNASAGTANISASFNGTRRAVLTIFTGTGNPPLAPSPTATAAPNQVTLNWAATSGTYDIKRSRVPGGPYTTIFAGLSGTSYVDTDVINGFTYYYVVSARNNFGQATSSEVSATPILGQVADPVITYNSGPVTLSDPTTGSKIYYTLDGTEPTEGSTVYKTQFSITTTTTIKAKAFKNGYLPSNTASQKETIAISPYGTPVDCSSYLGNEALSGNSSDRAWLRGQSFLANHYSLGNFAPNSKIVISMASSQVNSFLNLFDDSGNLLASNDDDGTGGVNAKIVYTVPGSPTANGYFVEATTSLPGQAGAFALFLDCGTTPPQMMVADLAQNAIGNNAGISLGTSGNVFPNTLTTFGFVINNSAPVSTGSGLNLGRLQMVGDFNISQQLVPEIAPQQASSPIVVSLISSTLGPKHGTLTIPNDDPTKNPFVINFSTTVVDPNEFPSVSITSPTSGETIPDGNFADPGSITIQTTTTTTEFPIAVVQFFATLQGQNPVLIGQATAAPYSMNWIGAQPGSYTLSATVTDTAGRQAPSSPVSITIQAPTLRGTPSISPASSQYQGSVAVTVSPNDLPSGSTIIYSVFKTADAANPQQWYIYQQPVVLTYNDFGGSQVTFQARGVQNGVLSSIASATYTIEPPGQSFPPDAQILSPADGDKITSITSVTGEAALNPSDPGTFGSWRLEYHVHGDDSSPWVTFATGNSPVSSGSAFDANHPFDPTLLIDGLYDIRLTVMNAAGDTTSDEITVDVEGHQKIGNFTISFVDMTVPVAGMPIQVTRIYDSRDKGQGDFGIGWRLGLGDAKVQESGVLGDGWDQVAARFGFFPGFELQPLQSHRVTITLPGDMVYSFDESLDPEQSLFEQISSGHVIFTPLPGTYGSLTPVDVDSEVDVNPGLNGGYEFDVDDEIFNPKEFDLTTADGRTLRVKMGVGLESVTDLQGNIITFTSNGVYKNTTTSGNPDTQIISYTRETGGLNRIIAVTDQNNKSVQYSYGTGSQSPLDLVKVTDRMNQPTTFAYDLQHGLIDMVAPDGKHGTRNYYDDNGRLTKTVDGDNNVTSYTYGDHTETITQPLGNTKTYVYDDNGNVISQSEVLDPGGANTTVSIQSEFNDTSNPTKATKLTDQEGRVTLFNYRSDGMLLSSTDPQQRTTTYSYDNNGRMTSVVDPSGRTVLANEYNTQGNITKSTDASGGETIRTYYPDGTLATLQDPLGNITQFAYGGTVDIFDPNTGLLVTVQGDPGGVGKPTSSIDPKNHLTQFVYDKNGNQTHTVTTRTMNSGVVERVETVNEYDDNGRPTKSTLFGKVPGQALQSQVQFQRFYTVAGLLDHSIDDTGQQTTYAYDDNGRTVSIVTPDGNTNSTVYDANGQIVSSTLDTTDHRHITNRQVYDSLGREIATVNPDGTATTNLYDLSGLPIGSIDANGNASSSEYDDGGHLIKSTDANGNSVSYEYNEIGQEVSFTDANVHKTQFEYDNVGHLVKTIYPDNTFSTETYDLLGRKIAQTDQAGIITAFAYDSTGNLAYVTNAVGTTEQTIFQSVCDELGRVSQEFDPAQMAKAPADRKPTLYDYDFLGHLIKKTMPEGQSEANVYAVVNSTMQVTHTDFNGTVTLLQYDAMKRMTQASLVSTTTVPPAGQASTVVAFDPATGLRSSMTDASGMTTYTYDLMGRLTQKNHSLLGALNYTYDNVGNVLTIKSSHANGVSLTYHWDKLNRLIEADDAAGAATKYDYDNVGNLLDFTYPTTAPVKTAYNYNSLNRLTLMNVTGATGVGGTLAVFDYNSVVPLSPSGKRMAVSETINAATTISRVVRYSYDNQYRLTNESISGNGITGSIYYGPQNGVPNTGYDASGNRRSRLVNLNTLITGFGSVTSSFDNNNRLSNATYDQNGNTLADGALVGPNVVIPTAAHPDQYDLENCLIHRTDGTRDIQIVYDGDGRRMWKTVTPSSPPTTFYLTDDVNPSGNPQVLEELTINGGSLQVVKVYNYGLDLISQAPVGGNKSYYGYDGHGNVRFLTDAAGNITDTYIYDAFGVLLSQTGNTPNNYLYCGEQFDPDLGTYYLRARYMNPNSGRFWTPDAYEGSQEVPMSLHKYLYAYDEPVSGKDPTGLYTLLPSDPISGLKVQFRVWADFKVQMAALNFLEDILFHNKSVHGIMDYLLGYVDDWRLRPDYVNKKNGEVYECKPVEQALVGAAQVREYISVLNKAEPRGPTENPWHPGSIYTPTVGWVWLPNRGPNVIAVVNDFVIDGVITYQVVRLDPDEEPERVKVRVREYSRQRINTMIENSARIATLTSLVWMILISAVLATIIVVLAVLLWPMIAAMFAALAAAIVEFFAIVVEVLA